jgi:hypothetical protein
MISSPSTTFADSPRSRPVLPESRAGPDPAGHPAHLGGARVNPAWAGVILVVAKAPLPVDFFDDEDDAPEPRRGAQPLDEPEPATEAGGGGGHHGGPHLPHGGPPANKQQARMRQIGFLVGAVVLLILVVIAFRGCMDARKDRSFENYVSDLTAITNDTEPLSTGFFDLLSGKGADQAAQDIGLQNQVNGDAGAAQGLLDRARSLDAPDELGSAQQQIVLSYELRHDALVGIASQLDDLGGNNSGKAEQAIYTQMKVLSASDILFARANDQITQELEDQGITVDEGVPQSRFLPKNPNYLDPNELASALGGAEIGGTASDTACKDDGKTHGLGLVSSTLMPSGTALVAGGSVTAPAGDDSIEIQVQNQGDADESGIDVKVSGDVTGSDTIDSIAAGETATATIPLKSAKGTAQIDVDVATVGCEQVADNNKASYTVTF